MKRLPPALINRAALAAILVLLMGMMDWVYVNVLVAQFGEVGYPGFPNARHPASLRVWTWALALVPAVWISLGITRPSQVLYWCVYLMVLLPTAVVGAHSTMAPAQIVQMTLGTMGGVAIIHSAYLIPPLRLPDLRLGPGLFWSLLFLVSAIAYILTVRTFGSAVRLVTISEVYLQRAAWADVGAGPAVRYFMSWQSIVVNPFLIAFGIVRHRWLLFLLGLAGQLFFFAVAAQRYVLATTFIIIGLHFLVRRAGSNFGIKASAASVVAFSIPMLFRREGVDLVALLVDLFLHRLFINAGFLATLYFDFFSRNPKVHFAEAKPFNLILTSPYDVNYKESLSWDFWQMKNDPNANLFADGFAQWGYAGLMIEAAGLALAFWLLDSVCRQRRYAIGFSVLAVGSQVASVTNGQIPNMLFGGGFGVVILLLYLAPRSVVQGSGVEQSA